MTVKITFDNSAIQFIPLAGEQRLIQGGGKAVRWPL